MALTQLTADNGEAVTGYAQQGEIIDIQILSGEDQRLGSRQPLFYQTGRSSPEWSLVLYKTFTVQATALAEVKLLNAMMGQRVVIVDAFSRTWETFLKTVSARPKSGDSGAKWLITCNISGKTMPSTPTAFTTP